MYDDPRDLEAFTPMTFYNCGLVLHCRPGFLETEIFIPVGGGAKYNTYRTCFGEGGSRSIFLVCKNLVLVVDENSPRNLWSLGHILEVKPNTGDGLVRRFTLKIKSVVLERPIDKIVPLKAPRHESS